MELIWIWWIKLLQLQMDKSLGLSYAAVVRNSLHTENLEPQKPVHAKLQAKSWIDQIEEFENGILVSADLQ